jgi:hypothetical protein
MKHNIYSILPMALWSTPLLIHKYTHIVVFVIWRIP